MFRFGIIGAGGIAEKFCEAAAITGKAEIIAVASQNAERARNFAMRKSIPSWYEGYQEMVQRKDIDAIYIATTHNFHYENILLCLENNKPVICEKPMVCTYKEAEAIFTAAKSRNLFIMEAMWSRFLPAMTRAREWVQQGKIGNLVTADYTVGFRASANQQRIFDPALAGGALYDIGVYAIEGLTWFIDKPVTSVSSTIVHGSTGVDVIDSVSLGFDGTCTASFTATVLSRISSVLKIYGTEGTLTIPDPVHASQCVLERNDGETLSFSSPVENGFEFEIEEIIRCVESNLLESPVIPHHITLDCARIFDMCLKTQE